MSGTYVTDITHYLDNEGEIMATMPAPARKLASFLVLLIDVATEQHLPGVIESTILGRLSIGLVLFGPNGTRQSRQKAIGVFAGPDQ